MASSTPRPAALLAVAVLSGCMLPHPASAQSNNWAQPEHPPGGSPSCECIDPWERAAGGARAVHLETAPGSEQQLLLPADYGAGRCAAWDSAVEGSCVEADGRPLDSGQPSWCTKKWCYVNASACERPYSQSFVAWDDNTTATLPEDGLFYSYHTCGNLDSFVAERHYLALEGKNLRVSFPGDSDFGLDLFTAADGTKKGAVVDFMQDISVEGKFTWTRQDISQASRDLFSSSYTACTHDVALNATDLCIGSFWTTTERLLMTPFTANFNDNEFKLVTFKVEKQSMLSWQVMQGPLLPFTRNAWLVCVALVMYMSLSLRVIEGDPHEGSDDTTFVEHLTRVVGVHVDEHLCLRTIDRILSDILKCVYNGVVGITQGMHTEDVITLPGRFVSTGYTVFGLIFIATYTASTAAALLAQESAAPVQTLEDIVRGNDKLCVRTAMSHSFLLRYPEFIGRLQTRDHVTKSAYTDEPGLLEDMDSGLCGAAVIMQEAFDRVFTEGTGAVHCNKHVSGGALLTEGNAMPVRDEIETAIGYLVAKHVTAGNYKTLLSQWEGEKKVDPVCSKDTTDDSGTPGFNSLTVGHLMGPFCFTFVCTTIGLLIYFLFGYALDDVAALASYATNYGEQGNLSKSDTELQKQIRTMTFLELWEKGKELQKQDSRPMPEDVLMKAVDDGPRTDKIIQAIFKYSCSSLRFYLIELSERSLTDVVKIAEALDVDPKDVADAVNHVSAPKELLLGLIANKVDIDGDEELSAKEIAILESKLKNASENLGKTTPKKQAFENESKLKNASENLDKTTPKKQAFENPINIE